jgi:hypothetical protein
MASSLGWMPLLIVRSHSTHTTKQIASVFANSYTARKTQKQLSKHEKHILRGATYIFATLIL